MPATLYACRDAQSTTYTLDRAARHPCSLDPERSSMAWSVQGVRFLGMLNGSSWCVSRADSSTRYGADAPMESLYSLCHARCTAVPWTAERNIAQGYGSPHTATPCAMVRARHAGGETALLYGETLCPVCVVSVPIRTVRLSRPRCMQDPVTDQRHPLVRVQNGAPVASGSPHVLCPSGAPSG